jgi:hypothetical protein
MRDRSLFTKILQSCLSLASAHNGKCFKYLLPRLFHSVSCIITAPGLLSISEKNSVVYRQTWSESEVSAWILKVCEHMKTNEKLKSVSTNTPIVMDTYLMGGILHCFGSDINAMISTISDAPVKADVGAFGTLSKLILLMIENRDTCDMKLRGFIPAATNQTEEQLLALCAANQSLTSSLKTLGFDIENCFKPPTSVENSAVSTNPAFNFSEIPRPVLLSTSSNKKKIITSSAAKKATKGGKVAKEKASKSTNKTGKRKADNDAVFDNRSSRKKKRKVQRQQDESNDYDDDGSAANDDDDIGEAPSGHDDSSNDEQMLSEDVSESSSSSESDGDSPTTDPLSEAIEAASRTADGKVNHSYDILPGDFVWVEVKKYLEVIGEIDGRKIPAETKYISGEVVCKVDNFNWKVCLDPDPLGTEGGERITLDLVPPSMLSVYFSCHMPMEQLKNAWFEYCNGKKREVPRGKSHNKKTMVTYSLSCTIYMYI